MYNKDSADIQDGVDKKMGVLRIGMKNIGNIILVDDDRITNFLHLKLLDAMDIHANIKVVYNGEDALELIKSEFTAKQKRGQQVLIFLDINMPCMNGFEFLDKFNEFYKEMLPNTSVIMLSSSVNKQDKEMARMYDVDGYLEKPLTEIKLKKILCMS